LREAPAVGGRILWCVSQLVCLAAGAFAALQHERKMAHQIVCVKAYVALHNDTRQRCADATQPKQRALTTCIFGFLGGQVTPSLPRVRPSPA
jgi:hypothetical protein